MRRGVIPRQARDECGAVAGLAFPDGEHPPAGFPEFAALIRLCLKPEARPEKYPVADEVLVKANAIYPISLAKLKRMRQRLAENGFTSFAEA